MPTVAIEGAFYVVSGDLTGRKYAISPWDEHNLKADDKARAKAGLVFDGMKCKQMLDWHPSKVLGTNVYQQPVKLWDLRAGLSACKMCPYGAHPIWQYSGRHPSGFYPDQPRQTHDRVMVWHTWSHPRQASATLVPVARLVAPKASQRYLGPRFGLIGTPCHQVAA
eukprot:Em0378g3a